MIRPEPPLRTVQPLSDCPPEVGAALWALEDCRARTLRSLAGATDAAVDEQPVPSGNSIGTLLYHIAAIEADWLFTEILEREIEPSVAGLFPFDVRDPQGRLSRVGRLPLADHLHLLAAVRAVLLASLRGMPASDLHRVRSFTDYRVTPAWVLHHLTQHEAEHRGQIMDLRRRFDAHTPD